MARRRVSEHFEIDFGDHNPEWARIRNDAGIVRSFHNRGQQWTKRLNQELHEAQAKDNEPVEDGYTYHITHGGARTRARLYVNTFTARAAAHEARNQSLLKLMVIGEAAHAGVPVDPDLPAELARREKHHKKAEKKRARKRAQAEARRLAAGPAGFDLQGNPIHDLDHP